MKIKANMNVTDKLSRLLGAVLLVILYYKGILTGTIGAVSLFVALLLTLTSMIGFCPVYALFGINTLKKKSEKNKVQ